MSMCGWVEMSIKEIIGWKLCYSDKTVSSKDMSWEKAPSEDVQILTVYYQETYKIWRDGVEYEEHYHDMYFGYDYYWQFGNGQANDVPESAKVKLGKELPQEEWRRIYNQALRDVVF